MFSIINAKKCIYIEHFFQNILYEYFFERYFIWILSILLSSSNQILSGVCAWRNKLIKLMRFYMKTNSCDEKTQ